MKKYSHVIPCNRITTIHLSEYASDATHIFLVVKSGAEVICIDDRTFDESTMQCRLDLIVHANAWVQYCDMRRFSDSAHIEESIIISAERDAVVQFEQRQQNAQRMKTTIEAHLVGEHAEIDMRVGMWMSGTQSYELITRQHHHVAKTKSNCVVKAIVTDRAKSFYEGMIQIDRGAQNSQAFQKHAAVLMSDSAYAYARPSLQVETDDVQCGHGSAIGQLDEEQQQYMQARGIAPHRVKELLLHAFMDDLYSSKSMKNKVEMS